ncbi:MAG: CHAT domain-containing protein [Caldilineaceae bacterium]|nr:CHAT domain-containing protein [Caldilineaceae bacterium]
MENFDLRISDHDGYNMRMAVIHSQAGEVAPSEVEAPSYTALELVEEPDARLRAVAEQFTAQVLPAAVWQAWRESWAAAGAGGIRLRSGCADANSMRIPWELLYDGERKNFLAQDPRLAVVRYWEGAIPDGVKPIAGPLRMLLTGATPADQVELGVGKELDGIEAALADAKRAGRAAFTRLDDLTPDALDRALLEVKPHLFHFSGHGVWDERAGAGQLLLDNGRGQSAELADAKLAMLLRSRGVALVVLNACETALGGDGWGGLAQSLVLAGVPAVVAMQAPVSDAAAAAFAGTLYAALANQYPLEQAVTLARQTTARQSAGAAGPGEWLAPVLFMRTGSERFWQQEAAEQPQASLDRISIGAIHAINVALRDQFIDQRGADITLGDKQIDTGGGAYVAGNVTVGGDFVGRDKIERPGGDRGPDASKAFTKLAAAVALRASTADVDKAMQCVQAMQQAFEQGDDDKVADCIGELADLAPDVKESLKQAFSHPALHERVGPVTKYALRRLG